MKRRTRILLAFAAVAAVAVAFATAAQEVRHVVVVKVGETAAKAEKSDKLDDDDHSLKVNDLAYGKPDYWVKGPNGKKYKIRLEREQIVRMAEGTTVLLETDTTQDGEKAPKIVVALTLKEERVREAPSSGW